MVILNFWIPMQEYALVLAWESAIICQHTELFVDLFHGTFPTFCFPWRLMHETVHINHFFFNSRNFIKKKGYKDNSLTYIRWTSRGKESIKTVAWNKGEQQNGNKTKPKKPTSPD
jgi:hypothetical protein